jgi:hypothetical protein
MITVSVFHQWGARDDSQDRRSGELTEAKTWERIISGFEDGLTFVGFALWFN